MVSSHPRVIGVRTGVSTQLDALALDSDPSRVKQAKRWAKAFDLCQETVEGRLRTAALRACEDNQKRIAEQNKRMQAAVSEAFSGGQESPPKHTPITLDEARPVYCKWLADLDDDVLEVTFGTVMAHRVDGDPVWLFVIGPPGDGKTEVLRSTSKDPTVYMLSSLKLASLISGFQNDNGPEPSLLP